MRIVFMGSAELSCKSLEALLGDDAIEVVLAITQPDRPQGRNLRIKACPARAMAEERGIKVLSPVDVNAPEVLAELKSANAECFAVVAYGCILKPAVLALPRMGAINVHTSLLPKYRGAAPIQRAVANGDTVTGVTTMYIDEKMDQGDIIYQEQERIHPDDTGGSLHDRLAVRGGALLLKTLHAIAENAAPRVEQNHKSASYAPKLRKQDGRIDWKEGNEVIYNKVRGFNPWPVCWCRSGNAIAKKADCAVRIYRAMCVDGDGEPGMVIETCETGIDIGTGSGILRVLELQAEGGKRMCVEEFLRGHVVQKGEVLG